MMEGTERHQQADNRIAVIPYAFMLIRMGSQPVVPGREEVSVSRFLHKGGVIRDLVLAADAKPVPPVDGNVGDAGIAVGGLGQESAHREISKHFLPFGKARVAYGVIPVLGHVAVEDQGGDIVNLHLDHVHVRAVFLHLLQGRGFNVGADYGSRFCKEQEGERAEREDEQDNDKGDQTAF
ncbi:hypothetical protein [Paenibacillus sp. FSL R5-808]|uniref:hypothetical protein n=1 Tax=Paenibacillus sp. FSL W8-1287 TaxID=2954653 RepID=UPI001F3A0B7B|nr:hypothetical protein [Paenibacillus sp. FSL R5-808]